MSRLLFDRAGLSVSVAARPGGPRLSFGTGPAGAFLTEAEARELSRAIRNWLTLREGAGGPELDPPFDTPEPATVAPRRAKKP